MKKRLLLIVAIALTMTTQTLLAASLSPLEVYGSACIGGVMSGFQKDLPDGYLLPQPDSYGGFTALVGVRGYLLEQVGIETIAGLGSTSAKSDQIRDALSMYDYKFVLAGLVLRYNISPGPRGWTSILVGGGGSYADVTLASEFTNLAASNNDYFLSTEPDFGWYLKAGLAYYLGQHLFADLTVYYLNINSKFVPTGFQLDGTHFIVAFSLGAAVF